ncbi:MAG: phosphatidate cytidylyltransferase [Bacteroidetes bacterium]|nr:phosphatidate cytidylyltransferase [Bacteroidota bacterium]MBL0065817.1 phosphatidate cytidylyltransferase [Bacteroidota bacterium]MBL0137884.1 phosphatidate cytidylyltransferase [Bacteroidota bacterium]
MSNFLQRLFTALIGAAVVIFSILYSEWTFLLLLVLMVTLGLREFYSLSKGEGIQPQAMFGILLGLVPFLSPLLNSALKIELNFLPLLLILPYFIFIRELYTKAEKPFTNIAYTLLGPIYISASVFMFYLFSFQGLEQGTYHGTNIVGYFLLLWANDTGAYLAGRWLGKTKLFERISPKKTWEGVFGGIVLTAIVASIISHYFTNIDVVNWYFIAGIIILTGTLGDLVESLFKRSVHTKDSSSLLPGHGGVLDRFDGLFISAPFVFFYMLMIFS